MFNKKTLFVVLLFLVGFVFCTQHTADAFEYTIEIFGQEVVVECVWKACFPPGLGISYDPETGCFEGTYCGIAFECEVIWCPGQNPPGGEVDDTSNNNTDTSGNNDDSSHNNDDSSHNNDDSSHNNDDSSHNNDDSSHNNDDSSHNNDDSSHNNDDSSGNNS